MSFSGRLRLKAHGLRPNINAWTISIWATGRLASSSGDCKAGSGKARALCCGKGLQGGSGDAAVRGDLREPGIIVLEARRLDPQPRPRKGRGPPYRPSMKFRSICLSDSTGRPFRVMGA